MDQGPASETVSFDPPGVKRRRAPVHTWVKVLALIVLPAVLIIAGFRVHDWWTHPTLFGGTWGNTTSISTYPETTLSFALSGPHCGHADTVTFRGTPEHTWGVNNAAATLTVEICYIEAGGYVPRQFDFNNVPPAEFSCSSLKPVREGTTFRYPSPNEYLVALVQTAKPGRTTLETITYNYQAGTHPWSQRGLDTQNFHITFHSR